MACDRHSWGLGRLSTARLLWCSLTCLLILGLAVSVITLVFILSSQQQMPLLPTTTPWPESQKDSSLVASTISSILWRNGCRFYNPCGPNAQCKSFGLVLACSCRQGFVGRPPVCRRRDQQQDKKCFSSEDCPDHQMCVSFRCVDPCSSGVVSCGQWAHCLVVKHLTLCSCPWHHLGGNVGDAFQSCEPSGAAYHKGPVLIAAGVGHDERVLGDTELIDLEEEKNCQAADVPELPLAVHGAAGGLLHDEPTPRPLVCGGVTATWTVSRSCFALDNGHWRSLANMSVARAYASASSLMVIPPGLYLAGGHDEIEQRHATADVVLIHQGMGAAAITLPLPVDSHCLITINASLMMLIGGRTHSGLVSSDTFLYSFPQATWRPGPNLKTGRMLHSCGMIRPRQDSSELQILVAGGSSDKGESLLDSVEILNMDNVDEGWSAAAKLPFPLQGAAVVENMSDSSLVLIGGSSANKKHAPVDTMIKYRSNTWHVLKQLKLRVARAFHVAFRIPEYLVNAC